MEILLSSMPMLLQRENNNYSIYRLEDYIPGVSYCTSSKDWMDQSLFFQYFMEPPTYQFNIHHHTKYVWIDNCTAHNMTPTLVVVLAQKQTILKYLPTCAIHLCQTANIFYYLSNQKCMNKAIVG